MNRRTVDYHPHWRSWGRGLENCFLCGHVASRLVHLLEADSPTAMQVHVGSFQNSNPSSHFAIPLAGVPLGCRLLTDQVRWLGPRGL